MFRLSYNLIWTWKIRHTWSVLLSRIHASSESAALRRRTIVYILMKMVEIFNTIMATATVTSTQTTSARRNTVPVTGLRGVKSVHWTVRVVRRSVLIGCFSIFHYLRSKCKRSEDRWVLATRRFEGASKCRLGYNCCIVILHKCWCVVKRWRQ